MIKQEEDHYGDNDYGDDEEEALSLRDFPISNKEEEPRNSSFSNSSFEFFTDMTPISHAEDIFYSGKLLPINQQSNFKLVESFHQCRSESLSELKSNRSGSTKARLVRNSRSFDDRKLKRVSSMKSEVIGRNPVKPQPRARARPGWYITTFGSVKYPREMELRDMKKRQVKMFGWRRDADDEEEEEKCASKLLRVLSCKGRSSVAVRASSFHVQAAL